jgi:FtsP/CotA-like multicopper oxidase with cupredoxin domain
MTSCLAITTTSEHRPTMTGMYITTPIHDPIRQDAPAPRPPDPPREWRDWMMVAIGLTALVAIIAAAVSIVAFAESGSDTTTRVVTRAQPAPAATVAAAPTLAQAKGVEYEPFKPVDATLPAVPPGAVKKFHVDVMQHVVQVSPDLAPTEVWTYVVNGKAWRGTGASEPIVVNQGDNVEITLTNGGSKAMNVTMPHSIDFHSAEVAPNKYYKDIEPGKSLKIRFTADHPGVFMYHCATQPVLTHVANGMAGMMVVKPKGLAPVDKELWMTQSEYYIGQPGKGADQAKMTAETPDVIAFNGYANQYKAAPISVKRGERIRMYVLNAGPSKWSAFHVIGTVFDRTVVEGMVGHDSQTINLAPSQGGWTEFTLAQEGNFPFVTHSFGDMVRGAAGILHTAHAPALPKAATAPQPAAAKGIGVTLGEMWVKTSTPTAKAGKVTFNVSNTGATMHQFAIGADPLTMDGGEPAASAAIAKGEMLHNGDSETLTADLEPGRYVLYCLMGGHYAAGQHIPFTVLG